MMNVRFPNDCAPKNGRPSAGARPRPDGGVALVTTVIVVAMLAVVGVALMQSVTADRASSRSVANYTRAQLAAEAGLSAGAASLGSAIINGRSGREQWNYISGHLSANPSISRPASNAESDSFAFVSQVDPASGEITNTTFLASTSSGAEDTLVRLSSDPVDAAYPAKWIYLTYTDQAGKVTTNARYAFWISDDTTKLNPMVMGSAASRGFSTDPPSVRLMTRQNPAIRGANELVPPSVISPLVSMAAASTFRHWDNSGDIQLNSPSVLTLGTFKLGIGEGLAPAQSLENDMALETLSAPIAPSGRPKINLTRLKTYLDSLPKSQSAGNMRFQTLLDVLDASKVDTHRNWGGGDLSFLLDPDIMGDKYTEQEVQQFTANLFDALDEDFIPTCDNANSPSLLGTEMRKTATGLQGHPFIVYAGTGHFAGRRNPNGTSRIRTHLALGFANPWPVQTESWNNFYTLDMQVTPSSPIFPVLSSGNAEELGSKPAGVASGIPPRSGFLFPCRSSSAPHYSALFDYSGSIPRVDDLTFTINRARLIYKSTEGDFVVGVLPGSPSLQALPVSVPEGGDGQNRLAWQPNRQSYWLRSDPRLHAEAVRWTITPNGAGGAASGIIPGPQSAINYMQSTDEGDGAQGLSGTIPSGMPSTSADQWYRSGSITNHFAMDNSLLYTNAKTRVASIGFLGFINVGKPWQTVALHNSNPNNPEDKEDWKILDYVYSGDEIRAGGAFLHADMGSGSSYGPGGNRQDWPGAFSRDGSINAHTLNWNSWRSALEGVPGANANAAASSLVNPAAEPLDSTFDFLRGADLSSGATTDFEREKVVRYISDMITSRSRSFTVYAVGEAIRNLTPGQPPKVESRSTVRAPLRIGLDTNSGGVLLQLQRPTSF